MLFLSSSIELSISCWITTKYNANPKISTSSVRAWIRYLLFVSTWTLVIGSVTVYCVAAPTTGGIVSSVAFHLFSYVLFYSTYHNSFSFQMSPTASLSHGFCGWQPPPQLPKKRPRCYTTAPTRCATTMTPHTARATIRMSLIVANFLHKKYSHGLLCASWSCSSL